MRVPRARKVQPMSKARVLVNENLSVILRVDSYTSFGQQYMYSVACGVILFCSRPFSIMLASASSSIINLEKHHRVEIACTPHLEIIHNKGIELSFYSVSQSLFNSVPVVSVVQHVREKTVSHAR